MSTQTPTSAHQADSIGRPREVADQWVAALNAHDLEHLASLYAEDTVIHSPLDPEPLHGRTAVKDDLARVQDALEDVTAELTEVVTDGTALALRILISGTHTGPLRTPAGELPPTGRTVRIAVASFERYDNTGRIREERRIFDATAFLQQFMTT